MPDIRRIALLLITLATGYQTRVTAQDSGAAQTGEPAVAPVVLDGDTLFSVRGVSSFPAERRAGRIAEAIQELAADRTLPVESLTVAETPLGTIVAAGGRGCLPWWMPTPSWKASQRPVLAEVYRRAGRGSHDGKFRHEREPAVPLAQCREGIGGDARPGAGALARAEDPAPGPGDAGPALPGQGQRTSRWAQSRSSAQSSCGRACIGPSGGGGPARTGRRLSLPRLRAAPLPLDQGARQQHLTPILLRPAGRRSAPARSGSSPDLVFLIVLALLTRWLLKLVRLFFRAGDGRHPDPGGIRARLGPPHRPDRAAPGDRLRPGHRLPATSRARARRRSRASRSSSAWSSPWARSSVIGNMVAGQSLAFRRAFKLGDRVKIGEHVGEVTRDPPADDLPALAQERGDRDPNSLILNSEVVNFSTLARASRG